MDISASDVKLFLRCRRAWDYQSPNRQGLRSAAGPSASPLLVGTGVHLALAAHARGKDPIRAYDDFSADEEHAFRARHRELTGFDPWPTEINPLWQDLSLGRGLVRRYFAHHGEDCPLGEGYDYVKGTVELTFRVPIFDSDDWFVGTVDGIARDEHDRPWIVEHKTFAQRPRRDLLVHDYQFVGYCWAMTAVLGERIEGVLYDGIAKKLPNGPRLLQKGGLSRELTSAVDEQTYRDAIAKFDLHPADYADVLVKLRERDNGDESPFWTRWRLPVSDHQRTQFAAALPRIVHDMRHAAVYPNFSWATCPTCGVGDLCRAEEHGDDVEYLMRTRYATGGGSASYRRQGGPAVAVDARSLAEAIDP